MEDAGWFSFILRKHFSWTAESYNELSCGSKGEGTAHVLKADFQMFVNESKNPRKKS